MTTIILLKKAMERQLIPFRAMGTIPVISEYPLLINHNSKKVIGRAKVYCEKNEWKVKLTHALELPSKKISLAGTIERNEDKRMVSFGLLEVSLIVQK